MGKIIKVYKPNNKWLIIFALGMIVWLIIGIVFMDIWEVFQKDKSIFFICLSLFSSNGVLICINHLTRIELREDRLVKVRPFKRKEVPYDTLYSISLQRKGGDGRDSQFFILKDKEGGTLMTIKCDIFSEKQREDSFLKILQERNPELKMDYRTKNLIKE